MQKQITPVLLTYNEAPNIERSLSRLDWADKIIVVDSFSDDETLAIIQQFPNTQIFQRKFDTHTRQWNFALNETGIVTEWVLALDADYILTKTLVAELKILEPPKEITGFRAKFIYYVAGQPLVSSVYPPVTVLYRRAYAHYQQDGHTQKVVINGTVQHLRAPILHDDRKSLCHWVSSQNRYIRLEAQKLAQSDFKNLNWPDRIRAMYFIAPFAVPFYCLFIKGIIFNGLPGLHYALQRMFAELLLSLYLCDMKLKM
ncbi:glycosyltransferase family 2 protein [Desulfococcaceae bacterium HSG9]|nr:glycosyltransferase family 2 protein [Desulfococcaceae bacterium HSG9]